MARVCVKLVYVQLADDKLHVTSGRQLAALTFLYKELRLIKNKNMRKIREGNNLMLIASYPFFHKFYMHKKEIRWVLRTDE